MAQLVKNPSAMRETWVQSLGWEDPWRRKWQPTPVFLPGKLHGQRSFYSPWGHKESDTTEGLSLCVCLCIAGITRAQIFQVIVMVWAQVGKEFPDMRQNGREIKFIRVGDTVRTVGQLKGESTPLTS